MSLPVLAQHMASKGRGDDSMLVHMTPGEVHGLQALAMAHGGSLTVNPDTGLPEAGFLKSILPAILGFALAPLTAGTSLAFLGTPLGAAATVGGIGALATGSLKEGLMMGLGAYGGAGLGSSLASAGTGAISQAAGANIAALPTATTEAITSAAGANAAPTVGDYASGALFNTPPAASAPIASAINPASPDFGGAMFTGEPPVSAAAPTTAATTPTSFGPLTDAQAAPLKAYDLEMAQQRAVGNALAKATPTDTLKAGFESAAKDPSKFLTKQNLQYGLAAMSPMMMATNTVPGQDEDDDAMIRPYRFDPVSGQYTRLAPYPAKQANKRFADGGLAEQVRRSIDSAAPETQADDPVSRYRQMVMQEYANIGRTGFGTGNTQVDQPGYDYWVSQLESGNLQPENFRSAFRAELDRTISQNPEDAYSRQVSSYLNPAPPPPRTPTSQYDTMTGDSAAAYDYLMGKGAYPIRTTQPRVAIPYAEAVMGIAPDPTTQRYLWDESIGRYYVNPNYEPSIRDRRNADGATASSSGGGGSAYEDSGGPGNEGGGGPPGPPGGNEDGSNAGGCVDPNVMVRLAGGGQIRAGDLRVGDMLHTLHEATFVYGDFPVEYVEIIQQPKVEITFADQQQITVSTTHKFLNDAMKWVQVKDMAVGDKVLTAPDVGADNYKVVAKMVQLGDGPVVKMTVTDAHTYIADGLVSHNKARGGVVYRAPGGIVALAGGGMQSHLGDYSDGGRLLKGPGDGVSDSIPAVIANKRPARLADGEFVVPARVVSELGNGSTEAGARKLYAMMDRIQKNRSKTVGKGKVAVNSRSEKYLPA